MTDFAAFAGRRALITGGVGFIGSALAHRLLALGAAVTIVDNLFPDYGGNYANLTGIEEYVHLRVGDVRDTATMRELLAGQDFLFNLAGQTSHMGSMTDPWTDLEINCAAQLAILENCRDLNPSIRTVFTSTRQLYGKPDYLPVDERHPIRPVDVNGINKLAGEWYHLLYSSVYGIRSTVLRLTNTYGPRMRVKDARQTFIGIWIRKIIEGLPFEVWDGTQIRDFTYVDDCIEALLLAVSSDVAIGKVYNLGGTEAVSLTALAEELISANGGGSYVRKEFPADRRAIEIGDVRSDFSLIKSELGWKPKVMLADGLHRTIGYYRSRLREYL